MVGTAIHPQPTLQSPPPAIMPGNPTIGATMQNIVSAVTGPSIHAVERVLRDGIVPFYRDGCRESRQ